jgi:small conductance mechanosensitive channel
MFWQSELNDGPLMTNQLETLEQAKKTAVDLSIRYGPKVFIALIILVAGFFVARWVGRIFQRSLNKMNLEPPVRTLLLRLIRLLVMALFVLMALENLEINLLPLIAGLSVAGAGIALAMQGVLGNLAAGLTILITKPFRVEEYIQLQGVEGQVTAIELFATTLVHADKSRVVIPNRKIVGEILHNYGKIRQLDLTVGVAYGTNMSEALLTISQVLKASSRVLKEIEPMVGIASLGSSSIDIAVRPWVAVADFGPAGGEIYRSIVAEFNARKIEIPFRQIDVRLLNTPASA